MINTTLVYNFGQTVLDSSKKKKKAVTKKQTKDPDETQIIEDYEGECDQCESIKPQKACPICGPD